MLNLFLAILLGNFDAARKFHLKMRVIDKFAKYSSKGVKVSVILRNILGDD